MSSPSGRSTLTTSAPRSPSTIAASGPASTREKSATMIPSSGGRRSPAACTGSIYAYLGDGNDRRARPRRGRGAALRRGASSSRPIAAARCSSTRWRRWPPPAPSSVAVVVLGADADAVLAGVDLQGARPVICADWREGQAASLRAGVAALADEVDAIVITLGDQPQIDPRAIDRVAAARDPAIEAVRATYAGRPGHPVLLERSLFETVACAARRPGRPRPADRRRRQGRRVRRRRERSRYRSASSRSISSSSVAGSSPPR